MEVEVWKGVPGLEDAYQVSSHGRIRSLDRTIMAMSRWGSERPVRLQGKILKPWPGAEVEYLCIRLGAGGPIFSVHRLVAEIFIGAPGVGQTDVNHKNGVKTENHFRNLEWCTHADNVHHAIKTGLANPCKRVRGTPIRGGASIEFDSEKAAAAFVGHKRGNISSAACGKLRQAHGYFWQYI